MVVGPKLARGQPEPIDVHEFSRPRQGGVIQAHPASRVGLVPGGFLPRVLGATGRQVEVVVDSPWIPSPGAQLGDVASDRTDLIWRAVRDSRLPRNHVPAQKRPSHRIDLVVVGAVGECGALLDEVVNDVPPEIKDVTAA